MGLLLHWAFCNIGRFVIGRFVALGVLLHWAFCCIGRFVIGRFVIGRFVFGRFVPTPLAGWKSLVANRADKWPILFLRVFSYDMGS